MATDTMNMQIYGRRKGRNAMMMSLSLVAAGVGLIVLAAILWTLFFNGLNAVLFNGQESLNFSIFTTPTPAPGSAGGLSNAIWGSFILTFFGILIGAPVGILAGTFLAEYAKGTFLGELIKFLNDILLSAPSIVIGMFVWTLMVYPIGYSAYAGAVALAIIAIPVVVRTTEDMLNLVPVGLREAAAALGAPRWKVTTMICYRAAVNGMITGVLLAVARISGETAPLLFTALNNQFPVSGWIPPIVGPIANLPVTIYQFALSPFENWQNLAWGGALIITVTVLVLNILARSIASLTSKG